MANSKTDISSTTQKYLDIFDVSDDFLILKDGSTALILTVSAMNFGLLAEEEQDAIIYAYAALINSLTYPIQILVRSQTKDVTSYLQLLDDELGKADTELRRTWIKKYRQFVGDLIKERNVLDKKFYVVIPASSLEMGLLPPSTVLPGVKQPDLTTVEKSVILEKAKEILEPKRDHLLALFARIGLLARRLNTQEIIELFYLNYNPEAAEGQQITDTNSYTTALVSASTGGGIMPDMPITNDQVNPVAPAMPMAPAEPAMPAMPVAPVAPVMPEPTPVAPPTMPPAAPVAEEAQNEINNLVPPAMPMAPAEPAMPAAAAPQPESLPEI